MTYNAGISLAKEYNGTATSKGTAWQYERDSLSCVRNDSWGMDKNNLLEDEKYL